MTAGATMSARFAAAVLLAVACGATAAQSNDVVLRDGEVSAKRLEELLGDAPAQPLTRGLQPGDATRTIVPKPGDAAPPPARKNAAVLITFETDSAQLTDPSRRTLDEVARAFNADALGRLRFVVEGHADARGADDHNLRLSQARAEAVREYLVQRGVAQSRLQAVGKGEREPMNTREVAAPENRRVTFVRRD